MMKVHFDIAHPANVHYFKNLIFLLKQRGVDIIITAKDKDLVYQLLDVYSLQYYKLGYSGKSLLHRIWFIITASIKISLLLLKEKPDISISFGSSYCAIAAFINKIPFYVFDDTEHARLNRKIYLPLARKVFTPSSFNIDIGNKQERFKAFMELFYLHPSIFKPNEDVLKELKIKENEKFAVIRFISWDAFHDVGINKLSNDKKEEIISIVSKYMKVFVSVEGKYPKELQKYKLTTKIQDIHSVLYYSSIYIGEGATTASESAMLGTPAVYINKLTAGTLTDQENLKLLWQISNEDEIVPKLKSLLDDKNLKEKVVKNRDKMLKDLINPTEYFYKYFMSKLKNNK